MSLPADDLLSAFHDGELNPAERAAVEQRLAASVEARRELSEIRQVSLLLKGLPGESLPAEFPQQVLQAIEREMLIPSQQAEPVIVPEGESWGRGIRSRRWVGAAAVLTSAAGLLLLVRAVDDRSGRDASSMGQLAQSPKTLAAPAEFALDSATSGRDARNEFDNGAVPPPMAADAPTNEFRKNRKAGGAGGVSDSAAKAPAGASIAAAGVVSREKPNLFFDKSALRDAEIGDVVRAMQTEGDEVAVVWLTVVDRQKGLSGLQLLLAGDRNGRANSSEPKDKAATPSVSANQMHAVFVESDAVHLAAAIAQLRETELLESLEVDLPIELAQLSESHGGRMLAVDKLSGEGSPSRAASKADAAKAVPDPTSAKRRFAVPTPSAEEKKTISTAPASPAKHAPEKAKGLADAKEQLPKQVTLEFSREALVQNQLSQQSRNRGMPRSQVRFQATDGKSAENAPTEQRPMQVLFVVVDQARNTKQVPPSTVPKSSAPAKPRSEPAKPAGKDGAA